MGWILTAREMACTGQLCHPFSSSDRGLWLRRSSFSVPISCSLAIFGALFADFLWLPQLLQLWWTMHVMRAADWCDWHGQLDRPSQIPVGRLLIHSGHSRNFLLWKCRMFSSLSHFLQVSPVQQIRHLGHRCRHRQLEGPSLIPVHRGK